MPSQELIPILQIAIGPVILISGVGLLLLSMTNRFGRVIDRTRAVTREMRISPESQESATAQLTILLRRAHIIRAAIALCSLSVLLAALLVIILFISPMLQLASGGVITALFIACMLCLIAALVLFIVDINVSLSALKLEIGSGVLPPR